MSAINRRDFIARTGQAALGLGALGVLPRPRVARAQARPPNIVIIFADDLGYGDLSCYGHPTIHTPNLDRMAAEGAKLTQFYAAASVCTPSRAALMTGRLPIRSGMCSDRRRVLFPNSAGGLPDSEITIAEALKGAGYATACVGKWHLGHLPQFLPMRHGFDEYFGIPYSNDMKPSPLMDGDQVIEEPARQETLTIRYTERALRFIRGSKEKPFFLYFPHTFPHVPLFASDSYKGTSLRGLYGDVVQELDWSVGQILHCLRQEGLADNTFVLFTSDNGPWLTQKLNGGSAGLLRGGKGSTWEGGMREPCVVWWPGTVAAGTVRADVTSTMDLFPTCLALAGVDLPADRVFDGESIVPVLTGAGSKQGDMMLFYRGTRLMACRKGPWKAHLITQDGYGGKPEEHDPPALYNLNHDPSEKHDVAADHADVVAEVLAAIEEHRKTIEPVPSQLEALLPAGEEK
jgi:arylsulfatase A